MQFRETDSRGHLHTLFRNVYLCEQKKSVREEVSEYEWEKNIFKHVRCSGTAKFPLSIVNEDTSDEASNAAICIAGLRSSL